MSRFKLMRNDMPLRLRELPVFPTKIPRHGFDLAQGFSHKVLVALERFTALPHIVFFAALGLVDLGLASWIGVVTATTLGVAQLCDWLILMTLARRRISFGPVQAQWLELAVLRLLVALGLSALSVSVLHVNLDALLIAIQILGVSLVYYGFATAPSAIGLSHIELCVPSFKRGTRVKLLHVADVHLERCGVREEQLLAIARVSAPDLILFTGDFLNLSYVDDPIAQQQATELWCGLSKVAPVYAVSGSPAVDPQLVVAKLLTDTPVIWLRDELQCVCVRGNHLHIVGVTCTHDPWKDGESLRRVVQGQPSPQPRVASEPFTILLYHAPDLAPQAAALDAIDLQLAGHTHGGQLRLPWFGALVTASLYYKKLEIGLYQLHSMLLFVSRGVGLEGKGAPRMRFLCPPEVTLLTLHGEP